MKNNCLKTAILLCAQKSSSEIYTQNLVPPIDHNDGNILVKLVGQYLLKTAKATGLPVYEVNVHNLQGNNFRNKLRYSFDKLFEMSYDRVIVISNDYLHISKDTLLSAQDLLLTKDLVVGATFDGGSYLFGCSKLAYPQTNLLELRWGTNHLFEDVVMNAAVDNLSIGFLPTEIVVDTPSDFHLCQEKHPPFESLESEIENALNVFDSSLLQYDLPEIIDERIFYKPHYSIGETEEGFVFCLN